MNATIFNIQRYCIQDGPGVRTTVFFKGCPLRCKWCHNPESQLVCQQLMYYDFKCTGCQACIGCEARTFTPDGKSFITLNREKCMLCGKCIDACRTKANKICGRVEDVDKIFEVVLKDKMFYKDNGGMTLSGGEPSMQPEAALALLRKAKEAEITSVIETCGSGSSDFYNEAFELGTTFYFDIKAIDSQKHKELTGVPNDKILSNLEMLMGKGASIVLRMPLIPGMNDTDDDLEKLCEFLKKNEERYDHAEIMKYHILGSGKSKALDRDYDAPSENASDEDCKRWYEVLKSSTSKIKFS